MKYFLIFSGIELFSILLGFIGRSREKIKWMSREYSTALKGASMLIILWVHVGVTYGIQHIQFIGAVGVSLFIIFSGYGIQRSTECRGLKGYWRRRIVSIALPYWIVEAFGLFVTGQLTIKRYVLDFFFIQPAMGPGWFMQYIMICYLIYYLVCVIFKQNRDCRDIDGEEIILYGAFLVWLVLESLYFADPAMPFLKARQMLCFPFGITIAKHRDKTSELLDKQIVIMGGIIIGLVFMAITQLRVIKESTFLVQNILSLPTVFPMAISVIAITKRRDWFLDNRVLRVMGLISFEIYLVHIFTLGILKPSMPLLVLFIFITTAGASLLYLFREKLKKIIRS